MLESTLLLEVGSEALNDLTSDEKTAILARYTNAQVKYAGLKTFDLLRKKYQCNYKMGRMYEYLSQKYDAYERRYKEYSQAIKAGKIANEDTSDVKVVDGQKFRDVNEDLGDL